MVVLGSGFGTRHCLRNGFDAGAEGKEVILWEIEHSWSRGVRRDPPVAVATGGERRTPRPSTSQSEAENMFFRRALAPLKLEDRSLEDRSLYAACSRIARATSTSELPTMSGTGSTGLRGVPGRWTNAAAHPARRAPVVSQA